MPEPGHSQKDTAEDFPSAVSFCASSSMRAAPIFRCLPLPALSGKPIGRRRTQNSAALSRREGAAESMENVSKSLEQIDFVTMSKDISDLVLDADTSIKETMEKVEAIDFDSLNKSIEELRQVLEPLSEFFGMFGRGGNA